MSKPVILIIDDQPEIREMMSLILESDFQVFESSGGEPALKLAEEVQPDLILCDSLMPGMSGAELIERLRANPLTAGIPLVLVTGQTDPKEWKNQPIDAIVPKPFHYEELVETAMRLIDSSRFAAARSGRRMPASPSSAALRDDTSLPLP